MADKISASITYLDVSNNKGSKAITDISPTADNGAIKDFCVGLLGLTTNTLSQIDRVEKTDITNATVKPKLTLTLDQQFANGIRTKYSSMDTLFVETDLPNFTYKVELTTEPNKYAATLFYNEYQRKVYFASALDPSDPPLESGTYTMTIYFEETETTAATTAQLVISGNAAPVFTIL